MDELIQPIIALIIVIATLFLGNVRRKKPEQRKTQDESHTTDHASSETALPPFMENFPFDTETMPDFLGTEEAQTEEQMEAPIAAETPKEPPAEPSPVPVDSSRPTRRPAPKPIPAISIGDFSSQTFRQGIILAEILGPPKSRRARQRYNPEER